MKTALHPWLVCNIRVKYRGYQSKDELVSVGIRLIDGTMRFQMMDEMEHKNFVSAVPNFVSPCRKSFLTNELLSE